ncbi:MAG: hypothetical protein ABI442_21675 [Gemmatimonadaceae bacterium]
MQIEPVAPRQVIIELARRLAEDLSTDFDQLPGARFAGKVGRGTRRLTAFMPPRRVARVGIVAIGTDSELRWGVAHERIILHSSTETTASLVDWNDPRILRVPTTAQSLTAWSGGQSIEIATPAELFEALTRLSAVMRETAAHDRTLLDRPLSDGP